MMSIADRIRRFWYHDDIATMQRNVVTRTKAHAKAARGLIHSAHGARREIDRINRVWMHPTGRDCAEAFRSVFEPVENFTISRRWERLK